MSSSEGPDRGSKSSPIVLDDEILDDDVICEGVFAMREQVTEDEPIFGPLTQKEQDYENFLQYFKVIRHVNKCLVEAGCATFQELNSSIRKQIKYLQANKGPRPDTLSAAMLLETILASILLETVSASTCAVEAIVEKHFYEFIRDGVQKEMRGDMTKDMNDVLNGFSPKDDRAIPTEIILKHFSELVEIVKRRTAVDYDGLS